jgi:hypothetical protein
MTKTAGSLTVVICQDRVAHPGETALREKLLGRLVPWRDVHVKVLPHLYDLAPDGEAIKYLRSVQGDLMVLAWLYPRAAYWILEANEIGGRPGHSRFFPDDELKLGGDGQPPDGASSRTLWCIDLRPHQDATPLLDEIERIVVARGGASMPKAAAAAVTNGTTKVAETTRPRWYPVIDHGRCQTCMECLNFCLFGVFGLDMDGRLLVEQPEACRNGCPACARVCPAGAIMFPEHDNAAVAGDTNAPADDLNTDLLQLFGPRPAADLAAAEREAILGAEGVREARAGAKKPHAKKSPPRSGDALDGLVDELDASDL